MPVITKIRLFKKTKTKLFSSFGLLQIFLSEGRSKQNFRSSQPRRLTVQWQTRVSDPELTPWMLLEIPFLKNACFCMIVSLESQFSLEMMGFAAGEGYRQGQLVVWLVPFLYKQAKAKLTQTNKQNPSHSSVLML